jgi:hypothetical protein
MYDQAWLLCERLFPLMEALMGPEVALDTPIFAWSLRRATPLRTTSTTRKASSEAHSSKESTATHAIGDNFGVPHRDSRYSDCHTVEGQPTEISCWLPLVDVTPDSGCMLVVPAQHDPLFAASNHPLHMKPTEAMPWAHIRALSGRYLAMESQFDTLGILLRLFLRPRAEKVDCYGFHAAYSFM